MRKIYIINWRFQLRYITFMIIPIVLLGLFAVTIGFRVSYEIIASQRQQLMVMISNLEVALRDIEGYLTNKVALEKAVVGITNLKFFSQDLVTMNMMEVKRLTAMAALAMFIIIVGASIMGVFFSHRIAGPIFRLERCIREMSTKNIMTPIRVRANDEFQELAAYLEQLRKSLLEHTTKRQELVTKINGLLDTIEHNVSSGSPVSKQEIDNLKSEVTELKKIC